MISADFSALFARDLARLARQLDAFDDAHLWQVVPGIANSAGNLMLHLNGNLRAFVGRHLGAVPYTRNRDREFGAKDVPRSELVADLTGLVTLIPDVLKRVPSDRWDELFPENVLGTPLTNRHFVIHLYGHLNYHLGQIDYLRRTLSGQGALTKPK